MVKNVEKVSTAGAGKEIRIQVAFRPTRDASVFKEITKVPKDERAEWTRQMVSAGVLFWKMQQCTALPSVSTATPGADSVSSNVTGQRKASLDFSQLERVDF